MSLAVLCSGQGGQDAAMFDLVAAEPDGRAMFDAASATAGFDMVAAMQDVAKRFDNAVAQPSICALQLARWALLAPHLPVPVVFAGYSVGELGAHGCAGNLTMTDTIALARARASAMDAAGDPHDGLVAVRGIRRALLEALCKSHGVWPSIVNGEDQVIVGGAAEGLDALIDEAAAKGATTQRLPVHVAAHTPRLAEASAAFREHLQHAAWLHPSAPVLAGIDGSRVYDRDRAIDTLASQIETTIRWDRCMDAIAESGATVCLELGPGNALTRMMRERRDDIEARSVDEFRSLRAVVEWVGRESG